MITREHKYRNATVIVHRPELSDRDREAQEKRVIIALQQFGKEMVRKNDNGNDDKSRNFKK